MEIATFAGELTLKRIPDEWLGALRDGSPVLFCDMNIRITSIGYGPDGVRLTFRDELKREPEPDDDVITIEGPGRPDAYLERAYEMNSPVEHNDGVWYVTAYSQGPNGYKVELARAK